MNQNEFKATLQEFFPTLRVEAIESLLPFCTYTEMTRGTQLFEEGTYHHFSYLILQGSAKAHYSRQGKQVCIWFAFEKEVVGTLETFQGLPSKESIVLLEDSSLIRLPMKQIKSLADTDLAFSQSLNELLLEHAIYTEEKLRQLLFLTAKERYDTLREKSPNILQRVSLTDIASYLGVSRETLSRIRAMK